MQMDVDREKRREKEREEAAAAPKRLKMLEADEQPVRPRATYFALTGQMQEPVALGNDGAERGDMEVFFDDYSVKSGQWGSQGKVLPLRRNASLDQAFGKGQEGDEELMERSQTQERDRGMAWERQEAMEDMEIGKQKPIDLEKQRELEREAERQRELKKQRELDMERQKQLELARKKERAKQRELERERQLEFEMERQREQDRQRELKKQQEIQRQKEVERERQQDLERERERERQRELRERQREMERQKEVEKERLRLLELERQKDFERQKELEKERLRLLELERQKEVERQRELERQKELEKERLRLLELERQKELERERQRELERQKEERLRLQELERMRQSARHTLEMQREQQRLDELERVKEIERRQLLEFEKQKQAERDRQQILELEKQRLRDKMAREEAEKMRQIAIQQEIDRHRELERERERREMEEKAKEAEREKQRDLEVQRQRDVERQKQLDAERRELDNQRARQREAERQRLEEVERRQLLEFERQKQAERQRHQIMELEKQRLREKMEREEAEKKRQMANQHQEEAERQRLREKQRREDQERADSCPLRPKVLDLDTVTRDDQFSKSPAPSSDPSSRWRQPSPRTEDHYRPHILDIDSFRPQAQSSPTKEVFPAAGIQSAEPAGGAKEREGSSRRTGPEGGLGRPVWTPSLQEPWERGQGEAALERPTAGPEPPKIPAGKPSLEQLLLRQEERATAPCLAPERRWTGVPSELSPSGPYARREPTMAGSPVGGPGAPVEQGVFLREEESQGPEMFARGQRRSTGSQDLNRMRSRSVSRRSTPSESAVEGSLSRMRSRSAHRERDHQSWGEPEKPSAEEEGKETDTLVHETDSQYGTWETGLRTDDSLTPATPSSESNLTLSPRRPTSPHTPWGPATPSDLDLPDGQPLGEPEIPPLPFPEASAPLLDSSVLRSRAQLGKTRGPRSRPTRASRQSAALAALPQGPDGSSGSAEDWRYRDSTEEKVPAKEDSDSEEQQPRGADPRSTAPQPQRGADPRPAASQPQRVALFPGMDPSALKAQLKKRGDSDSVTDGPAPAPSQLSRSPKSPFLPRASRVLPPPGGKENGEEASPQWLKELKSKKRLSQYDNDS